MRQRKQTRRLTIGEACIRAVEAVHGSGLDGSTQEKALGSHSGASAAPASDKRERHWGTRERLGTVWIRAARQLQGTPWEALGAPVGTEEERQGGSDGYRREKTSSGGCDCRHGSSRGREIGRHRALLPGELRRGQGDPQGRGAADAVRGEAEALVLVGVGEGARAPGWWVEENEERGIPRGFGGTAAAE